MNSKFINDKKELYNIIHQCDVCYVGMVDDTDPYVLPFNFAIEENHLYIHSGPGGEKERILQKNNKICVAFSCEHKIYRQHEEVACSWGMLYKSVLIWGKTKKIENRDEKIRILNLIMKKYSGKDQFKYSDPAVNNVVVLDIEIEKITGKTRGY